MKTNSELKVFKSGEYEYIYVYWKQMGNVIRINTKYRPIKNQMTKELLFKSTVEDYLIKNEFITEIKRKTDNYISGKLREPWAYISQKECYNFVMGNWSKIENNGNYFNPLIKDLKKYIDIKINEHSYQPTTIKYYANLVSCLEDYEKHLQKILRLNHFTSKHSLIDFKKFLATDRGMNDNTIRKRLNSLKSFLRYINDEKLCSYDASIFNIKGDSFETNIIALSKEEIQQLIDLKITNSFWKKIVDLFVFNCYMGLRVSDLMTLSKGQFVNDDDNDFYYVKENIKTGITVTIPITDIPLAILKKYDFDMPVYTPQYFNRELEKILIHYKLFESTVILKRKVLKENKDTKVLKRELISSHTCRKSFITNCVSSGIALNVIMKASGHKQLQTLQAYVQKVSDKEQFKKLNR